MDTEYHRLYTRIIVYKSKFNRTEYNKFLELLNDVNSYGYRTLNMPSYDKYLIEIGSQNGIKTKHKNIIISFD
mgnify:CR=1 FL=1